MFSSNLSSRRRIVINGDDFGFSSGVNQAIIKAHSEGVLTSTSLMITGDAVYEAIAAARAHEQLAVGLHLVLVCGKAALPPDQIPHLVDSTGNFSNSAAILKRATNSIKQPTRNCGRKFVPS